MLQTFVVIINGRFALTPNANMLNNGPNYLSDEDRGGGPVPPVQPMLQNSWYPPTPHHYHPMTKINETSAVFN